MTAIGVGPLLRHQRRNQSESAKEMAFVDDPGHALDTVSSDDYEGEIFDVEAEGGSIDAVSTDRSAQWLTLGEEDSSSYFNGE
jgi:hypothetical protein